MFSKSFEIPHGNFLNPRDKGGRTPVITKHCKTHECQTKAKTSLFPFSWLHGSHGCGGNFYVAQNNILCFHSKVMLRIKGVGAGTNMNNAGTCEVYI